MTVYEELYDNSHTTVWPSELSERRDWQCIDRYIKSNFPQGATVLDYGCYTGGLLATLGPKYRRYGIEINRAAGQAARQHAIAIWDALELAATELRYDVIVLSDVIEHVPDPRALVDRLLRLLTNGGVVVISTGDADSTLWKLLGANWWYCSFLEHITFVSKSWLAVYAQVRDVELVHVESFRYTRLSRSRLLTDWPLAILYGISPHLYLKLGGLVKSRTLRGGQISVRGVGLTEDHLMAAVRRKH